MLRERIVGTARGRAFLGVATFWIWHDESFDSRQLSALSKKVLLTADNWWLTADFH
jgi:hypothetical protein